MLLTPFRIATSHIFLRTYLRTALLLLASTILLAVAVIAYTFFYYAYVPVRGVSIPVYLQYDHTTPLSQPTPSSDTAALPPRATRHPYGISNVHGLVTRQKYDVVVEMEVPRSEANLGAGNWMVGVEIRGAGSAGGGVRGMLGWDEGWDVEDHSCHAKASAATEKTSTDGAAGVVGKRPAVLASSRRPTILTYRSWTTELAYRLLRLPLYMLRWGQESERVAVRMMEDVEFEKGWRNVPSSLRLEVCSRTPLEVYRISVRFVAKLEGLRWVMYTHRLASFAVFTSMFWGVEMAVLLTTWAFFSLCLGGPSEDDSAAVGTRAIKLVSGATTPKTEPVDSELPTPLSDTSRTFPTLSSHQPLHYSASMKRERATPTLDDVPLKTEPEADDEDEDDESADFVMEEPLPRTLEGLLTDSGIGTSMDSGIEREGLGKRRSGGGKGGKRAR